MLDIKKLKDSNSFTALVLYEIIQQILGEDIRVYKRSSGRVKAIDSLREQSLGYLISNWIAGPLTRFWVDNFSKDIPIGQVLQFCQPIKGVPALLVNKPFFEGSTKTVGVADISSYYHNFWQPLSRTFDRGTVAKRAEIGERIIYILKGWPLEDIGNEYYFAVSFADIAIQ